ncbi:MULTISPECIES: response regulator [Acidobacteriaceae]|uniref:response regulator n=1 Tax=Acidobacteriaceae TaxID=204434 RepID=UPI00131CD596|nr:MULTISPECIES: response regulator [Acidobacteriaceae]MDW5266822.1 response regulator [Edaphobacter sp.]
MDVLESSRAFKCRVLIVDDESLVLQACAAIVRSFGFTVRTAEGGFVALKILREVLPDIIISDLRMPSMSGFELLSIVRRRFPHIPTIGISGEFILANMPLGLLVDHFFQKGEYTPEQLKAKMKKLIADSPIRAHIGKVDKAPLWIPRKDANYIVVTCPECLRSSSIADQGGSGDLQETEYIACGAIINYLVDSSVLKVLEEKGNGLPPRKSEA